MKYIRTKDGRIFDVSKICVPYQVIESWLDFNSQGRFEVINQADTIEELCDEFVVYAPNEERIMRYRSSEYFEKLKEIYKTIKEDKKEVYLYGAIWTEWGLKYIAKMNEKGELELL